MQVKRLHLDISAGIMDTKPDFLTAWRLPVMHSFGIIQSDVIYPDMSYETSVLSELYSGKPPCLNFHQTALSAVNDATASPPFSALLMKIYPAEFRQI